LSIFIYLFWVLFLFNKDDEDWMKMKMREE